MTSLKARSRSTVMPSSATNTTSSTRSETRDPTSLESMRSPNSASRTRPLARPRSSSAEICESRSPWYSSGSIGRSPSRSRGACWSAVATASKKRSIACGVSSPSANRCQVSSREFTPRRSPSIHTGVSGSLSSSVHAPSTSSSRCCPVSRRASLRSAFEPASQIPKSPAAARTCACRLVTWGLDVHAPSLCVKRRSTLTDPADP